MTEHTPRPWTVEVLKELTSSGERRPASYISSSQGWANSGMAGKRTIAIVGHWRDRPNPEADARLIAAAPDLLEALKALLEGRPTEEPPMGDFPKEKSIAYKNWLLFENARKAIRKATAGNLSDGAEEPVSHEDNTHRQKHHTPTCVARLLAGYSDCICGYRKATE